MGPLSMECNKPFRPQARDLCQRRKRSHKKCFRTLIFLPSLRRRRLCGQTPALLYFPAGGRIRDQLRLNGFFLSHLRGRLSRSYFCGGQKYHEHARRPLSPPYGFLKQVDPFEGTTSVIGTFQSSHRPLLSLYSKPVHRSLHAASQAFKLLWPSFPYL